ncbi:MAG: hypothetical protein EPO68_17365 [Planctomycetota bacterium]|nr:MAG: hypothetical protein EPO68_17365 [Planctomycetota bacterium]
MSIIDENGGPSAAESVHGAGSDRVPEPPRASADPGPGAWAEELIRAVSDLIAIQKDRLAQAARAWLLRIGVCVALAVGGSLWLGSAVLATVRGMRGGFAELFGGRPWAGDLAGGVLALALVVAAARIFVTRSTRAELERLRRKYEPPAENLDGRAPTTL